MPHLVSRHWLACLFRVKQINWKIIFLRARSPALEGGEALCSCTAPAAWRDAGGHVVLGLAVAGNGGKRQNGLLKFIQPHPLSSQQMPRPSSRTAAQFARAGLQKAHALCAELHGLEFLWGLQETEVCLVMEDVNSETPKCTGNLQCYGLSVSGRISIPFVWWKIHRKLLSLKIG